MPCCARAGEPPKKSNLRSTPSTKWKYLEAEARRNARKNGGVAMGENDELDAIAKAEAEARADADRRVVFDFDSSEEERRQQRLIDRHHHEEEEQEDVHGRLSSSYGSGGEYSVRSKGSTADLRISRRGDAVVVYGEDSPSPRDDEAPWDYSYQDGADTGKRAKSNRDKRLSSGSNVSAGELGDRLQRLTAKLSTDEKLSPAEREKVRKERDQLLRELDTINKRVERMRESIVNQGAALDISSATPTPVHSRATTPSDFVSYAPKPSKRASVAEREGSDYVPNPNAAARQALREDSADHERHRRASQRKSSDTDSDQYERELEKELARDREQRERQKDEREQERKDRERQRERDERQREREEDDKARAQRRSSTQQAARRASAGGARDRRSIGDNVALSPAKRRLSQAKKRTEYSSGLLLSDDSESGGKWEQKGKPPASPRKIPSNQFPLSPTTSSFSTSEIPLGTSVSRRLPVAPPPSKLPVPKSLMASIGGLPGSSGDTFPRKSLGGRASIASPAKPQTTAKSRASLCISSATSSSSPPALRSEDNAGLAAILRSVGATGRGRRATEVEANRFLRRAGRTTVTYQRALLYDTAQEHTQLGVFLDAQGKVLLAVERHATTPSRSKSKGDRGSRRSEGPGHSGSDYGPTGRSNARYDILSISDGDFTDDTDTTQLSSVRSPKPKKDKEQDATGKKRTRKRKRVLRRKKRERKRV